MIKINGFSFLGLSKFLFRADIDRIARLKRKYEMLKRPDTMRSLCIMSVAMR